MEILLTKDSEEPPGKSVNTVSRLLPQNDGLFKADDPAGRLWPGVTSDQWNDWRWQMLHRVRTMEDISCLLDLKPYQKTRYKRLIDTFHCSITPYYLSLIRDISDPEDPIRKQCVPDLRELEFQMVGVTDPLEEEEDMQTPGLVHRYPDRVLAIVTNTCSMYCRHCTRKRIWHEGESARTKKELQGMVEYVRATPEVREVIVSGGDPFTMNLDLLDWFLGAMQRVSHVEVMRIGTRVPVVMPMKVTDELVSMLKKHRPIWINTQFNHPREVTTEAAEACDRLLTAGIPVSNQSVLLKGINDTPDIMKDLCHALQRIMVRPYYLFQCDPVRGVEHFRTSLWKGIEIMETMRGYTGGLAIPTFVVDAPGGGGKIPLQPFYLLSVNDKDVLLRNYEGMIINYFNPGNNSEKTRRPGVNGKKLGGTAQLLKGQRKALVPEETPRYKRRKQKNSLFPPSSTIGQQQDSHSPVSGISGPSGPGAPVRADLSGRFRIPEKQKEEVFEGEAEMI
ncbi:MAG: KamA family radical SAM protein [Nitrospiraceae bacterium]|nr:KamA family radical SAM protein [Nitrospiraceae bacterium]